MLFWEDDAVTEKEWLAATDPTPMLEYLRDKASDRKLRLFACGCCRRIWEFLSYAPREWIAVAEQYADGKVSRQELNTAATAAKNDVADWSLGRQAEEIAFGVTSVDMDSIDERGANWASQTGATATATASAAGWGDTYQGERLIHTRLLRCIFGNPFRLSSPLPAAILAWNDDTVKRIAEGVYDDRSLPDGTLDTSRLAILADALLDAGCDDEELLAHLRSPGPHVRGCFAIDIILGRS